MKVEMSNEHDQSSMEAEITKEEGSMASDKEHLELKKMLLWRNVGEREGI